MLSPMIIVWLLWVVPGSLLAQETGVYSVKWIGQFPEEREPAGRSWGERITSLLIGERSMALVKPFGVVAAHPEDLCILDQGAGTLLKVDQGRAKMVRSMNRGSQEYPSLVGISEGNGSDLYVTDSRLNLVCRVAGEQIEPITGAATLQQPTGIAFHPLSQELWVCETAGHRIAILGSDGRLIKRIGKRGADPGEFNFPTFIWIDGEGKVYIVDSMNFRVQVLDAEGNFLFCFGENGDGTGQMARPKGIATDSHGNIYLADALFHVVQVFDREGHYLDNFGGQGQGHGEFWMPAGIFIDRQDCIYVADSYNAKIQIFQLVSP